MKNTLLTMVGAVLFLAGCGCGREEPPPSQVREAPSAGASAIAAATAAPVEESVGIPACDEYFRQAALCFSHNVIMRGQMEESTAALRQTLIRMAKEPENRERLAGQCQAHTEVLIKDCAN